MAQPWHECRKNVASTVKRTINNAQTYFAAKPPHLCRGASRSWSGVDLTFATAWPRVREANIKSYTPREAYICWWSLDAKVAAEKGCDCQNRTTRCEQSFARKLA